MGKYLFTNKNKNPQTRFQISQKSSSTRKARDGKEVSKGPKSRVSAAVSARKGVCINLVCATDDLNYPPINSE